MSNMDRARAIAQSVADQERAAQTMEAVAKKREERYAHAPSGASIRGTYERTPGRAEISEGSFRRNADGTLDFEHAGGTEVFWDSQETLKHGASGDRLYLDEEGEIWRESHLHLVEGNGNLAPGEIKREGASYEPTAIDLEERELATVLAALRYWQRNLEQGNCGEDDEFAPIAGEDPLSAGELDALCERLNCGT